MDKIETRARACVKVVPLEPGTWAVELIVGGYQHRLQEVRSESHAVEIAAGIQTGLAAEFRAVLAGR